MNSGEIHYRYHFPFHETLVCSKAFPTKKFPHSIKRKFLQRTKSIHDSIKKISLALFSSPKRKAKSKCVQKIAAERSNTSLFGCLSQMNSVKNPGKISPMKKDCFGLQLFSLPFLSFFDIFPLSHLPSCSFLYQRSPKSSTYYDRTLHRHHHPKSWQLSSSALELSFLGRYRMFMSRSCSFSVVQISL